MNREIFTKLREVLLRLYSESTDIRRVMDDCGIDSSRMSSSATPKNMWHAVLKEAEKNHQVSLVLDLAESEYGNNLDLKEACDAYRNSAPKALSNASELSASVNEQGAQLTQNNPLNLPVRQRKKSESGYLVWAYWFGPQVLQQWLWENRSNLSDASIENFCVLLTIEHATSYPYVQLDKHTVVSEVILNRDYIELIDNLDRDDFRNFVTFAIEKHLPDEYVWIQPSNTAPLRPILKAYFKQQLCISLISQNIKNAADQVNENISFAGQIGGRRTADTKRHLQAGYHEIREQVALLTKLLFEFINELTQKCNPEVAIIKTLFKRWRRYKARHRSKKLCVELF